MTLSYKPRSSTGAGFKNLFYAFADRGVAGLCSVMYVVWFANLLSKADYGLFVLSETVMIFLLALGSLSIGQALVHLGSPAKEKKAFWGCVYSALLVKASIYLVIVAGMYGLSIVGGAFPWHGALSVLRWPILCLLAGSVLLDSSVQILNARQDTRGMFFVDTILLGFTSAVLFFITHKATSLNAQKAIMVLACIRFVAGACGVLFVGARLGFTTAPVSVGMMKRVAAYAKASFINSMASFVLSRTDIVMLGVMLTQVDVASYGAAIVFTRVFVLLSEPANLIGLPKISRIHHGAEKGNVGSTYLKLMGLSVAVSILPALLMLLMPRQILALFYGGKYAEGATLIRIFAVWGLLMPVYRSAATVLNGIGRPGLNARFTWLAALVNIAANIPLIALYGIHGAAMATLVSSVVLVVSFTLVIGREAFRHRADERFVDNAKELVTYDSVLHEQRYTIAARWCKAGDMVLDCACGSGHGSVILSAIADYTGVDIDPDTVAEAERRYGAHGVFTVYNGTRLPFGDASFDLVCSIETIEHLQKANHPAFIAELLRVLKPGGTLVTTTPNRNYLFKWFLKLTGWNNPYHLYEYTFPEFKAQFMQRTDCIVKQAFVMGAALPLPLPHVARRGRLGEMIRRVGVFWLNLGRVLPWFSNSIVVVCEKRLVTRA